MIDELQINLKILYMKQKKEIERNELGSQAYLLNVYLEDANDHGKKFPDAIISAPYWYYESFKNLISLKFTT